MFQGYSQKERTFQGGNIVKLLKWLDEHFEETLMMGLIAVIVVVMGAQVFMRYAVGMSLPWPEELGRYCFVWFAFLGMSYSIRHNLNMRIDTLPAFFPALLKPFTLIADVVYFVFCIIMINPGLIAIQRLIASNQHSPAMHLPIWIVYLALLTGLCLSILRLLQKYVLLLINSKKTSKA